MKGLPTTWLHASDEIYSQLRGPAKNITVLATALPDKTKFPTATFKKARAATDPGVAAWIAIEICALVSGSTRRMARAARPR